MSHVPGNAYPPDWPRCVSCGDYALDGHLTCGRVQCNESGARDARVEPAGIAVGQRFCTAHEHGCVATTLPDENGEFLALDSDGVECSFNVSMVARHA